MCTTVVLQSCWSYKQTNDAGLVHLVFRSCGPLGASWSRHVTSTCDMIHLILSLPVFAHKNRSGTYPVDSLWRWYCRDRVSSCNIYAVQQDTQSVLMSEFYSAFMLARHVSDLTGPSSGAFCTSCIRSMWYYCAYYSTRPAVTAGSVQQYAYYHIPNLRIQLVQNAPDDGPVRSETCRANISAE